MALYSELPVYKRSYDLLMEIVSLANDLPRSFKYTFGERMQTESFELIVNIYKANTNEIKAPYIQHSREHLEIIRLAVRVLHDTRQISVKRLAMLNEIIEEVSKQLSGWQKSSEKK